MIATCPVSTYSVVTALDARERAAGIFPDLRGFGFRGQGHASLRTRSVFLRGWRFGTVESSGHWLDLNDESRIGLLLPQRGAIHVEHAGEARTARPGEMLHIGVGRRNTIVDTDYHGYVVLVPVSDLAHRLHLQGIDGSQGLTHRFEGGLADRDPNSRLRHELLTFVDALRGLPIDASSDATLCGGLAVLADLILEQQAAAAWRRPDPSGPASARQVEVAEAFMREHRADPISVGEVAAHLGIGVRALQLAFRRHRNTTPLRFLAARRLELLHERLSRAAPVDTVMSTALDCGIGSPGRIAHRYRAMYGEFPSETLARTRCG